VHLLVNKNFDIITIVITTTITIIVSIVTGRNKGYSHSSGFKFHTATLSILCDVPSIAVFCSESVESSVDIVSKFFF
jgi:hypothetical protein